MKSSGPLMYDITWKVQTMHNSIAMSFLHMEFEVTKAREVHFATVPDSKREQF